MLAEDGTDDALGDDSVEEGTNAELEGTPVDDDVELQIPKSGWQPAPQKLSPVPQYPYSEQQGPEGAFAQVWPPAFAPHEPAGQVDAGADDEDCAVLEDSTEAVDDEATDAIEEAVEEARVELSRALEDDVELHSP